MKPASLAGPPETTSTGTECLRPHPALRPYVSHYWLLSGSYRAGEARSVQRILTWGNPLFLFQLGDPIDVWGSDGRWHKRPAAFTEGHFRSPFDARYVGNFRLLGISFLQGNIQHFLKDSQEQINDRFVDLRDILGAAASHLTERLAACSTLSEMAPILDESLLRMIPDQARMDRGLHHAVLLAARQPNRVNVEQLAYEACLSPRQFERRFRFALGLSPKYFCRISRLGMFIRTKSRLPDTSLTRLSHECGYFDQAHFINDFKNFTGVTPSTYLASDHTVVASVSRLDDELDR